MKVSRPHGCLLALCLSTPSCAYLEGRGADALDVFTFEASAGLGAHAGVQLTDYLGTGIGYSDQNALALHGRYAGLGKRTSMGMITIFGSYFELLDEESPLTPVLGAAPPEPAVQPESIADQGNILLVPMWWWFDPNHNAVRHLDPEDGTVVYESPRVSRLYARGIRSFDITVGASVMVGAHVGFSPGEFVDFLLGWFGVDIAGDDTRDEDAG